MRIEDIDTYKSNVLAEAQRKRTVPDEGAQQAGFVLEGAGVSAAGGGEQIDVGASEIGQRLSLEVAPHIFDRIQLRGVGREIELLPIQHIEEDLGLKAAMDLGAIPDQEQRITKVASELLQEPPHRGGIEVRIDPQLKVQAQLAPVGADAKRGDSRDLLEVAGTMPEGWSLPARAPGASHHREQEQPALVDENQPSVQPPGFFLIRGHCSLTQRWMPSSSRSNARRVGRCGLKPSERSSRPM